MNDVTNVNYDGLIPNNVGLNDDRRVRKALEQWHPGYIDWWMEMGPEGFQNSLVYLRTAVSVDPKCWAKFDYVRMPEYKWGILLAPQVEGRTEPASVEQQRHLGKTAPSLYDMRNLFQVNVEEGRHLWAMVYLLQKYFGADGREEAEALLQRRSGDADTPRMLGAFNEQTPDWLSFFMFTFFIERTCEAMKGAGIDDPYDQEAVRKLGVIDLPTLQKKANLHFSLTLDLFGNEISTNAANAFHAGLKGRFREDKLDDDHQLEDASYGVLRLIDGDVRSVEVPALSALNMRLRDDYVADCESGVKRWNRILEKAGVPFELKLPSVAFNRKIGEFRDVHTDTAGRLLSNEDWEKRQGEFLPSSHDRDFVEELMARTPQREPGRFASWIAPPKVGIDNKPGDFEYVKIM